MLQRHGHPVGNTEQWHNLYFVYIKQISAEILKFFKFICPTQSSVVDDLFISQTGKVQVDLTSDSDEGADVFLYSIYKYLLCCP